MLRQLGLFVIFRYFVLACFVVAVYKGFNGDLGAIAVAVWEWIQRGADVVTSLWNSINA
jgi:hypothetical protein